MTNSGAGESHLPEARSVDRGGLSSVDNALRLLKLITEHQSLRVAEVAELLDVTRSTAHRLLAALKHRDFVVQNRPNGAYRPGPALNAIGLAAINRLDVRRLAEPFMTELRDITKETVTLAVLEGHNVRFIASTEGPRSVRVGSRTGVIRLAHASAVGKAILAQLTPTELGHRYPSSQLDRATPETITDRGALATELSTVKRLGYAVNWEESSDGIVAIATALHDSAGYPVAALGVAAPTSRMRSVDLMRTLVPPMLETARRIDALAVRDN